MPCKEDQNYPTDLFIVTFFSLLTQAEFEAKKAKEKVTNLDGENEVIMLFQEEKNKNNFFVFFNLLKILYFHS